MHRFTLCLLVPLFALVLACSTEPAASTTPAADAGPADASVDVGGADAGATADTTTAADAGADGGTDAGGAADTTGGGLDWAAMGFLERQKYMQTTVEPTMRKLYQAFDAKRYANFGCNTCHGKNQAAVGSKMPNTLTGLNPAKMPDPASSNAYEAKFAKFMNQQVLPEMLKLLNVKPFDPGTGKGFGCFSCHTTIK